MKKLSLLNPQRWLALAAMLAALSGFSLSPVAAQTIEPIISPADLKTLVEKNAVRVLDIREIFQTDGKTPNFAAGHIPGSIPTPYSSIRGPAANPGQMISEEKFSELVGKWGITPDMHLVFVGTGGDSTDFGSNARFYWTFKIAGFKKLSILDGGLGAWMALQYPMSTAEPKITPTQVKLKFDRDQIVDHNYITKAMPELLGKPAATGSKKLRFIDSRPEEYFLGEDKHPSAARAGTLPGAIHFDQDEFFQINTGKLLPKAKIEALAKEAGLFGQEEAISFCNTGHWSVTMWFVMSEILGQKNIKVYPESAIGWSKTKLPMDNQPKRTKVLMNELKQGVANLKN